jgi:ribose transport system substrate-binding protein
LASITRSISFVVDVERGIEAAARQQGLELTIRRHEFDPQLAVTGVGELLSADAELIIVYNPDEYVSHIIADRCAQAKVPVIAITFPVPGAVLFGVNNYRVGLLGGEGLGEKVAQRWNGALDNVVILDIPERSPAQEARTTGMLEGLLKSVTVPEGGIWHGRIDRRVTTAKVIMAGFLEQHLEARHVAVLCYTDAIALGALEAVKEAGRTTDVLILSQGATSEVREELRRSRSPIWGAVAHFPERFGTKLVPLAQRILRGEQVPNTIYTEATLLTHANINRYYPKG